MLTRKHTRKQLNNTSFGGMLGMDVSFTRRLLLKRRILYHQRNIFVDCRIFRNASRISSKVLPSIFARYFRRRLEDEKLC